MVSLRPITLENLYAVIALRVKPEQEPFVASNAVSLAEAPHYPEAWPRAIYAEEEPVGFLMLHDESLRDEPRQQGFYYLWRLMIDARHQGRGVAHRALEQLAQHVSERPDAEVLLTSCKEGAGSPEPFYLQFGFARTGKIEHGEIELSFDLAQSGSRRVGGKR